MNKSKANLAVVSTLLFALRPRLDKAIKRQMLSLISLVISSMCILMPLAPAVSAAGPVSYTVNKTVIDVSGQGPAGNVTSAGDIISYQINVNNTAEENLTNVTVTDTMIGIINNVTNLSEGNNETLYGNYTVTQADLDNNGNGTGFIINNVTVVCDQNATANNATATTPIANCTIVKTVTGVTGDGNGNVTAAGDIISYRIDVDNGGRVDLTNVTVTDPLLGGILNVTDLGIGSNETLYGNYTVTQADIDNNGKGNGLISNNATVDCDQLGPKNTTVSTPITSYTIVETVTGVTGDGNGSVTAAGDIISYQINVNNTAGMGLTNVTVTDPLLGGILNVTDLGIGSNETLYGNYTVTQADIDNNGNGNGLISNNATVDCDQLGPKNATVTTQIKSCTIVKTVTGVTGNGNGNVTAAGDIISYQINVNNTAGMGLTNVTITDPMLGGLLLNMSDLGMGSNETVYGNYTVTQEDINNNGNGTGLIINNATVDCDQLGPKNATVTTQIKSCTIVKTVTGVTGNGNGNVTAAGDVINYEINVNNIAGMDLTNVTVTDPLLGGILNVTNLGIGINETLYGNYTVTRADINNNGNGTGFIINNATVDCDQLGPKNATVQVPIDTAASMEGIVTDVAGQGPGGNVTAAGDIITYQVNATNEGITDLTNVTVNGTLTNLTGPTSSINNDTVLNPGETWTYTGNYTVTQDDINNNGAVEGSLVNNAPASETAGDGFIKNKVTFDSDQLGPKDNTIQVPIERDPHYSISKSVINPDPTGDCIVNSPGDEIPYRIVVNNDGNVDLTGVSVNDPMISLTGPTGDDDEDNILNPGETWVFDGIYKLTQDDINNGNSIDNTATVGSNELPEESSDISQPIEQKVDLSIQKSITGIDEAGDFMINQPGDVINYRIAVENNGDVDLHNVHVTDSLIDDLSEPTGDSIDPGVLNPGETWMYDGDYIVTPADIESNGDGSGFITNTATVHCNEHSSESSSIEVPIIPASNFGNNENPESDLKADFSANPMSGYAPLSVQFTDKSTGSPTSWSWDFNNDGVADSNTQNTGYTYTTPGTYTVNLTVSNANGTNSKPETINVLQTASSNDGGGGGGSIGSATVGGSHSTDNTIAAANVTQPENNTSNIEQSTPANIEQTPVPKATSTPAKQSKKTPGFETICEITALFAAVFIYKRK